MSKDVGLQRIAWKVHHPIQTPTFKYYWRQKNSDTSKATGMSRPTCPTRSFETQQLYRVERRSVGGERKMEVVRERMYVGGLNPEVTGELLVEVFSQFGLVRTITWF